MTSHVINLSQGFSTVIDAESLDIISGYKWYAVRQGSGKVYAATNSRGGRGNTKRVYLHRLLRPCPTGFFIDHINGDALDNRLSNLRIATPAQNSQNNRVIRSSTGYRGVYRSGNGFIGRIANDGVIHYLGWFENAEEAAFLVNMKLVELRGDIGIRNDVDMGAVLSLLMKRKSDIERAIELATSWQKSNDLS